MRVFRRFTSITATMPLEMAGSWRPGVQLASIQKSGHPLKLQSSTAERKRPQDCAEFLTFSHLPLNCVVSGVFGICEDFGDCSVVAAKHPTSYLFGRQ